MHPATIIFESRHRQMHCHKVTAANYVLPPPTTKYVLRHPDHELRSASPDHELRFPTTTNSVLPSPTARYADLVAGVDLSDAVARAYVGDGLGAARRGYAPRLAPPAPDTTHDTHDTS
jgi:hypothetical protein